MNEDFNPKKRGLGRGLNALFEDEEGTYPQIGEDGQTPGLKRDMMGIELLEPGQYQPRRSFDEESIAELADSIRVHGLLQPILIRKLAGSAERYEIIAGERRWRASQKAQLHEVPVIVLDLTDTQALEIALIENLQREDLSPVDEALGFQKLMQEFGHTQEQLAKALGKSRPYIANAVRLLGLPERVLNHVRDGKLTAGHARALVTADNPEELARAIIAGNMTVRQAEQLVSGKPSKDKGAKVPANTEGGAPSHTSKDADTIALEKEISDLLGMNVSIDTSNYQNGKVTINFKSLDQLDDILQRLSSIPAGKRLLG
jgi:ParB family chromosome partitioning protein